MKTDVSRTKERILLLAGLSDQNLRDWDGANHDITWGWKRDINSQSRLVYFSGNMSRDGDQVYLKRFFFFYRAKVHEFHSDDFRSALEEARERFDRRGDSTMLEVAIKSDHVIVELSIGEPIHEDIDRTKRLKLRRPRKSITEPVLPDPVNHVDAKVMLPADFVRRLGSELRSRAAHSMRHA